MVKEIKKGTALITAFVILLSLILINTVIASYLSKDVNQLKSAEEFKISGYVSDNVMISYDWVLFLDGYVYTQLSWLEYSRRYNMDDIEFENLRGDKLGQVTLDLKGKLYSGIPPDFSGTLDSGAEIYTIKDVKRENAVIVLFNGNKQVFYRSYKALPTTNKPINLSLRDIFKMKSESPIITAVELRNYNDGAWVRTSGDLQLISLINEELPSKPVLNSHEIVKNPYGVEQQLVPVNLMFGDGSGLYMMVFPEANIANVFGGYVEISDKLALAFQELFAQGEQYVKIANLLPSDEEVNYLHFINHINGDEILCNDPGWSRQPLFQLFNYYRVEKIEVKPNIRLVMTATLGESKDNSMTVYFYETEGRYVVVKIDGHYYKPVKGKIIVEELTDYLYSYTGINDVLN